MTGISFVGSNWFVWVVKNNLCAASFAAHGTSREAHREAFSIQRAAFTSASYQRPAAGADPEDFRKATEWDNTDSGDFTRVLFVLWLVIETVPYMLPGCCFVSWIMSCSVQCWSRYPNTFSHLSFYSSVPPHFSDSTLKIQHRMFNL